LTGRALPGLLCDAGLDVGGEVTGSLARFGEPDFEMLRQSQEAIHPAAISAGLLTPDETNCLRQVMSSPDTVLTSAVVVAVSGRRIS
jgi:hypothetical protein